MNRQDRARVTDFVCGMRFNVEDAAATEEYASRTFYFCSVACREKFDDDRAFYARVADADSAPAS